MGVRPRLLAVAPQVSLIHEAGHRFSAYLRELERRLKRSADLVPSLETKREAASKFWSMVQAIQRVLAASDAEVGDLEPTKRELRNILGPWLWRSDYFHRAFHKPHGFAGDYSTLESFYGLEGDPCSDATRPAIVNCLDYVFATIPFVQALWERRHRFAHLLRDAYDAHRGPRLFSVLDVGCGSAPYARDFFRGLGEVSGVELTLVDSDQSAISFCRARALAEWDDQLRTHATEMRHLPVQLPRGSFDVVLATALFDEAEPEIAPELAARLVELVRPGGVVAVANFHLADPSRIVREWILDWPLVLRGEAELLSLFPVREDVEVHRSANGALLYAFVRG